MILNERDLREARSSLKALDAALSSEQVLEPMVKGLPPEVVFQVARAMKAERGQLADLIAAYEEAKDWGDHRPLQKRVGSDPG